MDDMPWMQVMIHRCPDSDRDKVAGLLAEKFSLDDGTEPLTDGAVYEVEEIRIGAATALTSQLIRLAPGCSFTAIQEDVAVHHYVPRLGRFDGDAAGTEVLLGYNQAADLITQGAVWECGMTMLEASFQVAYGIPWEAEITGTWDGQPVPAGSLRARAWESVIDDRYKKVTANLITRVTEFTRTLGELAEETFRTNLALWDHRARVGWNLLARDLPALALSLDGLCHALAEARDAGKLGPPPEPGQDGGAASAARNLPMTAAALACVVSDVYEGRRRP